jgi:tetratricopeptide (TPR) repeat protein
VEARMRSCNRWRTGLVALLAVYLMACAAGQKEFEVAQQLTQAGKYKEAIAYLEQAIEKEPGNAAYKQELAQLKETLIDTHVSRGNAALSAQDPVTLGAIERARSALMEARSVDASHNRVQALAERIEQESAALQNAVKALYDDAKRGMDNGDWLKAYFNLQQIQSRFPNYEDSYQLLTAVRETGSEALFGQAKDHFDQEDFKSAKSLLRQTLSLNPDYQPARGLLEEAGLRDNKAYFVDQAREAVTAQKWDRAVQAYERALEYDPEDDALQSLIVQVRAKAGQYYLQRASAHMRDGLVLRAIEEYRIAGKYIDNPADYQLGSLRRDLVARANYSAGQFKEQGQFGGAWFWYNQIQQIDPDHPNIFFLTQAMEDRIKQRVRKSIAVFDFGSPSDSTDAGIIVANNLITFLFNNASGDIKILERENLKSILEEMKLGQIGVVSAASAKEMGRVYGIDVAIMGSVLLFKVDASVSEGTKSVRYQIGTRIEDNIEYLNWAARNPDPKPQDLADAPPAKVTIPEYSEKDFGVSHHKKVGFVQLSFRIVDVRTGENIQVRTIERKETVEDETSAGLPEAGIAFDPLDIPTDTELLQQLTDDVVAELGREALRPMQNLEKTYFDEGENLLRRRNRLEAAERFVDAIFDENMKQVVDSPLTRKAHEHLADIFRSHQVVLGGLDS